MQRTGQLAWVGGLIMLFFFVLFWIFGISSWLTTIGTDSISATQATGLEALLWSNLNLIIFFVVLLAMFAVYRYGAQQ